MTLPSLAALDLGQEAWLRYRPLPNSALIPGPLEISPEWLGEDPVLESLRAEWSRARAALFPEAPADAGALRLCRGENLPAEASRIFCLTASEVRLEAADLPGALRGLFRLVRALQLREAMPGWELLHRPAIGLRAFLHFDNVWPKVDIERGYGGETLFDWRSLPEDPRGKLAAYARLLASCGFNAVVPNNVNAGEPEIGGWRLITDPWLGKVAALADIFRAWGIRLGLCIAYNAPELSRACPTSDPREEQVRDWWRSRAAAIFRAVPDFLGWVIKADSEGQAGPMSYGLDHAEGSRHLAEALAPHGGRLFWRCFVYGHEKTEITAQPYRQFVPLDGHFAPNVTLLIKNGPRDYQVREPLHPLFGALPQTNCALEIQATQEYLGHDVHAVFLPAQWEEIFSLPTQDGSPLRQWLPQQPAPAIFVVANTNDSPCWTGHLFAQANWYGAGRLAWNPELTARKIAQDWAAMTFESHLPVVETVERILLESYRTFEGYTAPYCLGQIYNAAQNWDADHFDPDPWRNNGSDWFYAGPDGVGFPRAKSEAFTQYPPKFRQRVADPQTCEIDYLLWFHRLPWDWRFPDGRTLLQTLCDRYRGSAAQVDSWIASWAALHGQVDALRFGHVLERLLRQRLHARLWARYLITYLHQQAGVPESLAE